MNNRSEKQRALKVGEQPQPTQRSKTAVQMLQKTLGNRRLMQLRRTIQRHASGGAPEWLKQDVGITSAMEQAGHREDAQIAAAQNTHIPTGGSALPHAIQTKAQQQLGVNTSNVRVLEGADSVCEPVGAHAFAAENDAGGHTIALSRNVDLDSADGQFTLWHELSHVGQQQRGETSDLDGLGGDEAKREQLEQQADADAQKVLSS